MPRLRWSDRELRLTFCTNVLPTATVEDLAANLQAILPGVRERLAPELGGGTFGLGLWIPAGAADHLARDVRALETFTATLDVLSAEVFTLNGFPWGDFHAERVKEKVFLPSWADEARLHYTAQLGDLLAGWLGEGETGSISTLPCGKKSLHGEASFPARCADNLLRLAARWHRVRENDGRTLMLGLEPEPGGTVETTAELIVFYREVLLARAPDVLVREGIGANAEDVVRRHLGVCFDACHQAVQFEDPEASLDALAAEAIPVAKLQISSALHVTRPGADATRQALLRRFAEPRYLHQVSRSTADGVVVADDLESVLDDPDWLRADTWRVHFHVPIHRRTVSGLQTTGAELRASLAHVLARDLTRHLEVETYTWGVLPGEERAVEGLVEGLAEELRWAWQRIDESAVRT